MWLPPNPWSRGWCWWLLQLVMGLLRSLPKNFRENHILGWKNKNHTKKRGISEGYWWGTDLGLGWSGRPFGPETRLTQHISPQKQRKVGTACNKARCIHEGLHVSLIPKASLSLMDHKSSTKSAFRREKIQRIYFLSKEGNPEALWKVKGTSICVIHNWMFLLVKGFYFYEKIENFVSYTTKKPHVHKQNAQRASKEGERGGINTTMLQSPVS